MSGVFDLCNILQFVIDRFNQGSFSEQSLVSHTRQWVLHIVFNFSDKLHRYPAVLSWWKQPREQYFLLQFYKTVIGKLAREKVFQMFIDIFLIIMLEAVETTGLKQDRNNQNISIIHTIELVVILLFLVFKYIFPLLKYKFFQKSSAI